MLENLNPIHLTLLENSFWNYAFWGAVGAFAATLFVSRKLKTEVTQPKSLVSFLSAIFLLFWDGIINSLVGGLTAIVVNHNLQFAVISGFFSQFIVLQMVVWSQTARFKIVVNETVEGIIRVLLKGFIEGRSKGIEKDGQSQ